MVPQVPLYGSIDADYGNRLRSASADGPVYMLNLTRYRPEAGYARSSNGTLFSGAAPSAQYAPLDVLAAVGARICFSADVLASWGYWHRATVVGYPSRHSFVAMAGRRDFREWHHSKSADIAETVVLGAVPAGDLPDQASTSLILLELWDGPEPAPIAPGTASGFAVEGTLVGDGRQWSGIRFTVIEPGTPLPLEPAPANYDALLVEPTIERWS